MTEVRPPLKISSRLMAALEIPDVGTLHLHAEGRDEEGRVVYHYVVEDTEHRVITEGKDLRSGVGAEVDYTDMMESLLSFLEDDGETYRSTMSGTPAQEWCYLNYEELGMARYELDPEEE